MSTDRPAARGLDSLHTAAGWGQPQSARQLRYVRLRGSFDFIGTGIRQVKRRRILPAISRCSGQDSRSINTTGVGQVTLSGLEGMTKKVTSGGFAFIWRWKQNQGPLFQGKKTRRRTGRAAVHAQGDGCQLGHEELLLFCHGPAAGRVLCHKLGRVQMADNAKAGSTTIKAEAVVDQAGGTTISAWQLSPPGPNSGIRSGESRSRGDVGP